MVVNKLMEKEKSLHKIVLIGAGNLATNLGKVLVSKGYSVVQVYSRQRIWPQHCLLHIPLHWMR